MFEKIRPMPREGRGAGKDERRTSTVKAFSQYVRICEEKHADDPAGVYDV